MLPGRFKNGPHARVAVLPLRFPGVGQGHGGFLGAVILRHQGLALRWARTYSVVVVLTRGGSAVAAVAALPGWASSAFLPLPMMDENANQNSARAASSAKRSRQTFYSPAYNATHSPTPCRPRLSLSVQSALQAHVYASAKHWCTRQMRIFGFCGSHGRKKSACCSALRTVSVTSTPS